MTEAMDRFPDLVNNLWRVCGVRLAVPLLLEVPTYYNWTKDKIRIMCERSHIAALPKPPNVVFKIADYMREVIQTYWDREKLIIETINEVRKRKEACATTYILKQRFLQKCNPTSQSACLKLFFFFFQKAILVQGKVTEAATEIIYEAPCVLPKNHRLFKLHFEVEEPKILVITRSHESAMPDDPEDNPSVLDFVGEF